MFAPGLARLMSYPPALSDLIVAPYSFSRDFMAERSVEGISSGQQCGELIGTSKVRYPLSTSSAIASIAVDDHRYEKVLMITSGRPFDSTTADRTRRANRPTSSVGRGMT